MVTTTDSTEEYRVKQYLRLGFTKYEAEKLSTSTVKLSGHMGSRLLDVATVRNVIDKGCSVKDAYHIYRP
jgi:hypothetical protein